MYLDPDFRKDPPKNADGSFVRHCVRCQKELKEGASVVMVSVNETTWEATLGGSFPLGMDCYRKISK